MSEDRLGLYLAGTRTAKSGQPNSALVPFYAGYLAFCREALKAPVAGHAKVAIVYTLARRSEVVHLGGEPIRIHDQHLGQTLSTCLRVMKLAPSLSAKARFFHRVLAEESLSVGDAAGATAGIYLCARFQEDWDAVPKLITDPKASIDLALQELFVIAHEYSHLMMEAWPELMASRRRVGDLLVKERQRRKDREADYAALEARYPGVETFESFKASGERQRQFHRAYAGALRDEVGCDDFALAVVLNYCKAYKLPAHHAFRAAFLALRHMRAVHYIRECVSPTKARWDVGGSLEVRLLQAREHMLRGVFELAAKAQDVVEQLDGFWEELQDLSDEQDREVDLPLLTEIIPSFARARNRVARKRRWRFADCAVAGELIGWEMRADHVQHVVL